MDETAIYRIRFQGAFDESWRQLLGAEWSIRIDDSMPVTTVVTGIIRDQAALMGLLNNLYDMGLPLLEVKCLKTSAVRPSSGGQ